MHAPSVTPTASHSFDQAVRSVMPAMSAVAPTVPSVSMLPEWVDPQAILNDLEAEGLDLSDAEPVAEAE